MPRSLRARLLAVTLPVTVVAVLIAGWVANRETRQQARKEVRAELLKPSLIEQNLRGLVQVNIEHKVDSGHDWDGLQEMVDQLSAQYDVRIVVRSDDHHVIADSGGSPDAPTRTAIRIEPPPSEDFLAARQVIMEGAVDASIACLQDNGIGYERQTNPDSGLPELKISLPGRVEPLPDGTTREGPPDRAVVDLANTCHEPVNEAAEQVDRLADRQQQFPPIDVALDHTGVDSAKFLSGGVSARLVLTLAAVALLTALITIAVARWMTRPIVRLTRAARRMATGALDERVPEDRGGELGELSRAFNSMAASLAEMDRLRRRMTSDIAHELRTPLSNIRGYLEAAQDGVAPLTPELIDSIHEDALLLQALVDDLQELAAAESGQLRLERVPTDLDDVAGSVVAAHQPRAAAAGVDLQFEPGLAARADVDPRRIRQVLTNLVENALRHTDPGGRVTVTSAALGDAVELTVRDTGVGISAEDLPHIFDRFYRADPSRQRATGGSGLGLAISRELVNAHGGELTVASTVGEGTAFTVRLPLPPVGSGGDAAPSPDEQPPQANHGPLRRGTKGPGDERSRTDTRALTHQASDGQAAVPAPPPAPRAGRAVDFTYVDVS